MKTKFIIIGYGWRAEFFGRAVKYLPEQFEISAIVTRTEERIAEIKQKEDVFVTTSLEEALNTNPDFALICTPRSITKDLLIELMEKKIPVLCETPPAHNIDDLNELWEKFTLLGGEIQVAEQYFLQPYYKTIMNIIENGYIGETTNAMISALHGYHAMSIFRKVLGVGFQNCTIKGQKFEFEVTQHNGRAGFVTDGNIVSKPRTWASLDFENGKVGFFDFTNDQYFSHIRTRRWNIQGVRGEISNDTVYYLNEDNYPVEQKLHRIDVGVNGITEWANKGYMFIDKAVYENPFYPARINDDEIAVAECLRLMKRYVDTGEDFYPLKEAMQDAYLSFVLDEAIKTGSEITTTNQSWV